MCFTQAAVAAAAVAAAVPTQGAATVAAEVPLELLNVAAHCLQLVPSAYVAISTSKLLTSVFTSFA
jgi:hypothetical protein